MAYMHCATLAQLMKALIKGGTVAELSEFSGLNESTVRRYLRVWKRAGVVYITRWKRDVAMKPLRVWQINFDNMPDAQKPQPLTQAEICRRYKLRRTQKTGQVQWRGVT